MDLSIIDFFQKIKDCEIAEIEMYNFLEKLTDNFEPFKLRLIAKDFDIFLYSLKDEYEANINEEDIEVAIKNLILKKRPIPKKHIHLPGTSSLLNTEILDLEQLLFPFEFFCCYQFRNIIVRKSEESPIENKSEKAKSSGKEGKSDDKKLYLSFKDIFRQNGWEKYISALMEIKPPLLNENREFIGNPNLHKGVICAWINELIKEGIVKQNINRSELAEVLNNEIKGLNLGISGKSFANDGKIYHNKFKKQLNKYLSN